MALRDAAIRLKLRADGFVGGLNTLKGKAEAVGKAIGKALSGPANKGLESMKSNFSDSISQAKELATMAAGIAGGFSAAAGVQGAMEITEHYENIALAIERATGVATTFSQVQSQVEATATKYKRTSAEMVELFDAIQEKTGDAALSFDLLDDGATAMNATGKGAQQLGSIMGVLNKKFHLTGPALQQGLADIIKFGNQGGITFEQMSEDLDELGSLGLFAGQTGAEGLSRILGMATKAAPKLKDMSEVITGIEALTEKLHQKGVVEGLVDAGGIKKALPDVLGTEDAIERMRVLLGAASKDAKKFDKFLEQAFESEFTGREEKVAFQVLFDPFKEAFDQARAQGKSTKEASAAGLAAFDAFTKELGNSGATFGKLQEQSARRMEGSGAKFRSATEMWNQAFTRPQMLDAMAKLADVAPQAAEALADLVGFVADNPLMAGAGFLAGRAALSGATTMAGEGVVKLAGAGWKGIGSKIAAEAVTHGGWGAAGKLIGAAGGIAIATAVAYELGKMGIDALTKDEHEANEKGSRAIAMGGVVAGGRDTEAKKKALAEAKAEVARLSQKGGIFSGEGAIGQAGLGLGAALGMFSGDEVKMTVDARQNQLAQAKNVVRELEESLQGLGKPGAAASKGLTNIAASAARLSAALDKAATSADKNKNGLPPPGGTNPGHD